MLGVSRALNLLVVAIDRALVLLKKVWEERAI
jgi:hypothetical protein